MPGTVPPNVPAGRDYALRGAQVEPTAAYWLTERAITVPELADVVSYTEPQAAPAPDSPRARMAIDFAADFPQTREDLDQELAVLQALAQSRGATPSYPQQVAGFDVTPLSRFLQLKPSPFGAIFDRVERSQPDIQSITDQHLRITVPTSANPPSLAVYEGRELARMFETETPGLYHRHALNWLLFSRSDVSPPRQARIWLALDMAIYTALSACWHYKWVRPDYRRLLRPAEFADRTGQALAVLFDDAVGPNGREADTEPRLSPCPSPGTPRHPAWPSGHSTYSAAASHLLEYFFSPDTLGVSDADLFAQFPSHKPNAQEIMQPGWVAAELRRMANNIGEARLWAGVHWIKDHVAGQKVGRAAAQAVIDAFEADCTVPYQPPPPPEQPCVPGNLPAPPTPAELGQQGPASRNNCAGNHDEVVRDAPMDRALLRRLGTF